MAFDAHKNFAYSTIATAPSPATSGTSLVVATGDGAKFPAVSFNATVWPTGTQPTTTNAEIVRVTNISSDTFTITRTQESTSARTIIVGDQIAATITVKTLTDVEVSLATSVYPVNSASSVGTVTRYAPEEHVHIGVGAAGITNTGNVAGNQSTTLGTMYFAGSYADTVSFSTGAGGAHTLWIQGGAMLSSYENDFGIISAQAVTMNGASLSDAVPFILPQPGSFSYIRIPVLMTTNSTTVATTGATLSASAAIYSTWNAVVYSLGVGASSQSLQYVASGSNGWTQLNSISVAVNGTQYSITQAFSANALGAGTTRTTQYSISNTNYSLSTNQIATEWSTARWLDINFANSLSAGAYWLIFGMSTSSASNSTGAGAFTNCNVRFSGNYALRQTDIPFGVMGSTNFTSNPLGAGSFSTAGGGTTNSLPLSAISSISSHMRFYFQMLRAV